MGRSLTQETRVFFRILFKANRWLSTSEILSRMIERVEIATEEGNPLGDIQGGITNQYSRDFLRSIVSAERRPGELYFRLALDDEQQELFEAEFGDDSES